MLSVSSTRCALFSILFLLLLASLFLHFFTSLNLYLPQGDDFITRQTKLLKLEEDLVLRYHQLQQEELELTEERINFQRFKEDQARHLSELNKRIENREQKLDRNEKSFQSSEQTGVNEYDLTWYQKNIRANVTKALREQSAWARAVRLISTCEADAANLLRNPKECSLISPRNLHQIPTSSKLNSSIDSANPLVFLLQIQRAGGTLLQNMAEREKQTLDLKLKENQIPFSVGWKRGRDLSPTQRNAIADHWDNFQVIAGQYGFGIHEILWGKPSFTKEKNLVFDPIDNSVRVAHSEIIPMARRGYIYVAMFRDPHDRLVSLYNSWKSPRTGVYNPRVGKSFEDFLQNSSLSHSNLKDNHQVRVLCGYPAITKAFGELNADDLVCAMENLREHVAVPLILERLEDGRKVLGKVLGWKGNPNDDEEEVKGSDFFNSSWSRGHFSKRAPSAAIPLTKFDALLYRYARCRFKKLLLACSDSENDDGSPS